MEAIILITKRDRRTPISLNQTALARSLRQQEEIRNLQRVTLKTLSHLRMMNLVLIMDLRLPLKNHLGKTRLPWMILVEETILITKRDRKIPISLIPNLRTRSRRQQEEIQNLQRVTLRTLPHLWMVNLLLMTDPRLPYQRPLGKARRLWMILVEAIILITKRDRKIPISLNQAVLTIQTLQRVTLGTLSHLQMMNLLSMTNPQLPYQKHLGKTPPPWMTLVEAIILITKPDRKILTFLIRVVLTIQTLQRVTLGTLSHPWTVNLFLMMDPHLPWKGLTHFSTMTPKVSRERDRVIRGL